MRRRMLGLGAAALVGSIAAPAGAEPWVERPIVLGPYRASFDFGVGGTGDGAGADLAWRVGLPVLAEVGVRTGARFGGSARAAGADAYARLFDHEPRSLGVAPWSSPELFVRLPLADVRFVTFGLETRFTVPARGARFGVAPGVPVRFHVARRARLDTGLLVPLDAAGWGISVPADLWLQAGDAFIGALTGVRFRRDASSHLDVLAGLGAGYTVGGVLDLKAQISTPRVDPRGRRDQPVDDARPTRLVGAGAGIGVTLP